MKGVSESVFRHGHRAAITYGASKGYCKGVTRDAVKSGRR
jgi:hypothetical protein